MSTLAEIEEAVPRLSLSELAELEGIIRQARHSSSKRPRQSALDLPPLQLGEMLRPLGNREEWYDEMLEGRA